MTRLLVFGENEHTEYVLQTLARLASHEIVALVDDEARPSVQRTGIPACNVAQVIERFDKASTSAFVVGGPGHLNQNRLSAYMDVKRLGYRVESLMSRDAIVANDLKLRENVYIAAGAQILPRVNLGANCWIHSNTIIGTGARLGSSCWIAEDCRIGDGAVLGKNCTLGRGVVIGAGVTLPAWSVIDEPIVLKESPATPIFIDARFRARVTLHGQ